MAALLLITGWHHYYNGNYQSGITVLKQAKAFMDVPPPQGEDDFGNLQLPLLNPVRDATLAYGDWGDRSRLADMGLYQWTTYRALCGTDLSATAGATLPALAV